MHTCRALARDLDSRAIATTAFAIAQVAAPRGPRACREWWSPMIAADAARRRDRHARRRWARTIPQHGNNRRWCVLVHRTGGRALHALRVEASLPRDGVRREAAGASGNGAHDRRRTGPARYRDSPAARRCDQRDAARPERRTGRGRHNQRHQANRRDNGVIDPSSRRHG